MSAQAKYERSLVSDSDKIQLANTITEHMDDEKLTNRLWSRYKNTLNKGEEYIVNPSTGRRRTKHVL